MYTGLSSKRQQQQSERLRLFEVVTIVVVIMILVNLSLTHIVDYIGRAKLAQVFFDAGHRRFEVAEALSLTGELPDSLQRTTTYRYEHARTDPQITAPVSFSTGFGKAQKDIENKLITKVTATDQSQAQTDTLRVVETARPQGYIGREPSTQQKFSGLDYVEADNLYVSGGSFYYLVDNLRAGSDNGDEIVSLVLNAGLRKKASSIWYSCAQATETSLGSAATSPSIIRIENTCR